MNMKLLFSAIVVGLCMTGPAASEALPDIHRGVYAIWTKPGAADGLPFISGGQVHMVWQTVQPAPDRYDFTEMRAALEKVAALGRYATVQINGNLHPAFLFDRVPHHPAQFSIQTRDKQGTLQYWHPVYVKAYTDLIAAYARELKASPLRSRIAGIRLNFNALGTEHMDIPEAERGAEHWVVPSGVAPAPAWTPQIAAAYRKTIVDAFIRNFSPGMPVFLRAGVVHESNTPPEIVQMVSAGKLGLFITGSEIEPRPAMANGWSPIFLEYCRTGKTICYAESWADAWGRHSTKRDPRWCGPEQYTYWRVLSDLNLGVSMIAVYGNDLEKANDPEFRAAFDFAARYAGYHASPSKSPGAWVALREGNVLKGDYTFLMKRRPGPMMRGEQEAGPAGQRFGAWARKLAKGDRVEFDLDPAFAASLAGRKAAVRVTYLDIGQGQLTLTASGHVFRSALTGSGKWKTAEFEIGSASFSGPIALVGDTELTLHMVEVRR